MITSEKVLDYAQVLLSHCRISIAYLEMYEGLCKQHNQHHNAVKEAVLFFKIIEKALASELMVETCKMFEDNSDVISVFKLKHICEQNKQLFQGITRDAIVNDELLPMPFSIDRLLKKVDEDLNKHKIVIDNLKAQRDQIWAHNDKKYFLEPDILENKCPIQFEEIKELLHLASDFSNMIIFAFTGLIVSPRFNPPGAYDKDIERIMKLMELGCQKEKENNGSPEI